MVEGLEGLGISWSWIREKPGGGKRGWKSLSQSEGSRVIIIGVEAPEEGVESKGRGFLRDGGQEVKAENGGTGRGMFFSSFHPRKFLRRRAAKGFPNMTRTLSGGVREEKEGRSQSPKRERKGSR